MSSWQGLAERYLEAYTKLDLDLWTELVDDDVLVVADAGTFRGRDAARALAAQTALLLPGRVAVLERVVGETETSIAVEHRLINPDRSAHDWLLAGTLSDVYDIADGRIAGIRTTYRPDDDDAWPADRVASPADTARVVDERRGLARLARLVAMDVSHEAIAGAGTEEVARLAGPRALGALLRLEGDTATVVATAGDQRWPSAPGQRRPVDAALAALRDSAVARRFGPGESLLGAPFAAECQALGIRSLVAVPVVVGGATWGLAIAGTPDPGPLPADVEAQIAGCTALIATAIAQSRAREELAALLAEQAALRRVATLVANGARASKVFAVTAAEIRNLLGADAAVLWRHGPGATATVVAVDSDRPLALKLGTRLATDGDAAMATVDGTDDATREHQLDRYAKLAAALAHAGGLRSAVGAPIVVDGRLWGAVAVSSRRAGVRDEATRRTIAFTELLATAIANADGRSQLVSSRARLVTAADDARRRVARDLHDGAQQRLVHTIVTLKLAQRAMQGDQRVGRSTEVLLADALEQAESANAELRDLSHGMLPVILANRGLRAAVDDLAARAGVPVTASVTAARLSPAIEASAYFVIAESLTNVAKHAHATHVSIQAWIDETTFYLELRDDGVGGARADGTGLLGLRDRITALGGRLALESPIGRGTWIRVELPS